MKRTKHDDHDETMRVIESDRSKDFNVGQSMASAAYCNGLQTPGYGGLAILRVAAVTCLDQDFR